MINWDDNLLYELAIYLMNQRRHNIVIMFSFILREMLLTMMNQPFSYTIHKHKKGRQYEPFC